MDNENRKLAALGKDDLIKMVLSLREDREKLMDGIVMGLNGPHGPAGLEIDGVLDAVREAGAALQAVGCHVSMFGFDWNEYRELPGLLNETLLHLAAEKSLADDRDIREMGKRTIAAIKSLRGLEEGSDAYAAAWDTAATLLAVAVADPDLPRRAREMGWTDPDWLDKMVPLRLLPLVIDGPGRYLTRSGHVADVDREGEGTFSFKGTVWRPRKGNRRPKPEYQIWHRSGRAVAMGEHPDDIVAKEE